jgi:hypothetical protein
MTLMIDDTELTYVAFWSTHRGGEEGIHQSPTRSYRYVASQTAANDADHSAIDTAVFPQGTTGNFNA